MKVTHTVQFPVLFYPISLISQVSFEGLLQELVVPSDDLGFYYPFPKVHGMSNYAAISTSVSEFQNLSWYHILNAALMTYYYIKVTQ